MKILYTTEATSVGGRTGTAKSSDGRLAVMLDTVTELGGAGGEGTNPEQLFAAGYAACFISTLHLVAAKQKIKLSADTTVTATVGIGPREDAAGFGLDIALSITLPDIDHDLAQELVAQADIVCPYSHLARHGADVRIAVA